MSPLKVLYLTGHPAEAQLSAPIIRRMKADPYFDVRVLDVYNDPKWKQRMVDVVYLEAGEAISWGNVDVVVSPCDRYEMILPTLYAFNTNKPIIRIYAGIQTSGGTHDDIYRRMLDSMGHILLCESEECKENLIMQGVEPWRLPTPFGITHLDDVELDYASCPAEPYAVFLMNPVTISEYETREETIRALHEAQQFIERTGGFLIILPPNGDRNSHDVLNAIHSHTRFLGSKALVYDERMARKRFLGLLEKCTLFISNSSSTVYEFPTLNSVGEVFNPSWRNAERTKPPKLEAGGSDRVIQVLKSIDWSDKERLLRKRFRY